MHQQHRYPKQTMRLDRIVGRSGTQPLSVLGLSRRAYNALQRHGVTTVEQLLGLREDDLWQMRQVGIKTVTEILTALAATDTAKLLDRHPLDADATPDLCLWEEWSLPAWLPDDPTSVSALKLQGRAGRALDRFGIRCVGEAALLHRRDLLSMRGIGTGSIVDIRIHLTEYAVERGRSASSRSHSDQSVVERSAAPQPPDVSFAFSEVIGQWLQGLNPRERSIVAKRLGLDGTAAWTLEQLGQEYGLTRERARQIVAKGFRRLAGLRNGNVLKPHSEALHAFLSDKEGLACTDEICRDVGLYVNLGGFDPLLCCQIMAGADSRFRWFGSLGVLSEGSKDRTAILTIRRELRKLLPEGTCSLPLSHLLLASTTSRSFQEHCGAQDEAFLIACLRTDPDVTLADGVVTWPERVGKAAQRIIDALRQLGIPAHYLEITARINAGLPADGQVTERDIWAVLQRYGSLFVRTRRGTYGLTSWEAEASSRRLELT